MTCTTPLTAHAYFSTACPLHVHHSGGAKGGAALLDQVAVDKAARGRGSAIVVKGAPRRMVQAAHALHHAAQALLHGLQFRV